jgi:hypothetical protein
VRCSRTAAGPGKLPYMFIRRAKKSGDNDKGCDQLFAALVTGKIPINKCFKMAQSSTLCLASTLSYGGDKFSEISELGLKSAIYFLIWKVRKSFCPPKLEYGRFFKVMCLKLLV